MDYHFRRFCFFVPSMIYPNTFANRNFRPNLMSEVAGCRLPALQNARLYFYSNVRERISGMILFYFARLGQAKAQ